METITNPQEGPQPKSNAISYKNSFTITLVVWFFIILSVGLTLYFMKINSYIPNNLIALYSSDLQPVIYSDKDFYIYQDINDSSLIGYGVFYNFVGTVTDVKQTPAGNQIFMSISDPALPPLLVLPETEVFFGYNHFNFTKKGSIADIKPNTYVRLVVYYSFKRHRWDLTEVYIPEKN